MLYLNLTPFVRSEREFFYTISSPASNFFAATYLFYTDILNTSSRIYLLKSENSSLKNKIGDMQKEIVELQEIIKTNQYSIDQKKYSNNLKLIVANIIGNKTIDKNTVYIINKGTSSGIFEKNTVVYKGYLVGNIIKVDNNTSQVKTIDSNSVEIPVETLKNGSSGIYTCENSVCFLDKVLTSSPLEIGDLIITSGVTDDYKRGFIIGKVTKIDSTPEQPFKKGIIAKELDLNSLTKLSVLVDEK